MRLFAAFIGLAWARALSLALPGQDSLNGPGPANFGRLAIRPFPNLPTLTYVYMKALWLDLP